MIKPHALATESPHGPWSCRACDVSDTMSAAAKGDTSTLVRLLERDPNQIAAECWYTQPIRFTVQGGNLEAVRVLLGAGADPGLVGMSGEDLITLARCRSQAAVCKQGKRDLLVRLLEAAAHVPPVLTECRSYLLSDPDMSAPSS